MVANSMAKMSRALRLKSGAAREAAKNDRRRLTR
jgi:hypothetical protein